MVNFDKYTNYVRLAFKEYDRCIVKPRVKEDRIEILIIIPKERPQKQVAFGELNIKFDQNGIEFFGDFLPDDYIDGWPDTVTVWEKYTEKEIYGFLDKKIAEYKNYIDNGYFFTYYDDTGRERNQFAEIYTGDFEGLDYEELYLKLMCKSEMEYSKMKSVTVTNFYGDIIVENKILH